MSQRSDGTFFHKSRHIWIAVVCSHWSLNGLNCEPLCILTPGNLSSLTLSIRQPPSQFPPPTKSHFGSHFHAFAYSSHLQILEVFPFLPLLSISPSQSNSNPISFLKTSPCSSTHIDIFLSEFLLYLQLRKISALNLKVEGALKYILCTLMISINWY